MAAQQEIVQSGGKSSMIETGQPKFKIPVPLWILNKHQLVLGSVELAK